MQNLFADAASTLLCPRHPQDTVAADVRALLEALDYAIEPPGQSDGTVRQRGLLLRAASRFARVFQLTAAEAPGLVCFGAEFDPAIADPLHAGSPLVGVSGVAAGANENVLLVLVTRWCYTYQATVSRIGLQLDRLVLQK